MISPAAYAKVLANRYAESIQKRHSSALLQFRDVSKLPLGFLDVPLHNRSVRWDPGLRPSDQQGRPLKEVADGHRYKGLW